MKFKYLLNSEKIYIDFFGIKLIYIYYGDRVFIIRKDKEYVFTVADKDKSIIFVPEYEKINKFYSFFINFLKKDFIKINRQIDMNLFLKEIIRKRRLEKV